MKTLSILICLIQLIAYCIITWKAESTLFAVLAYTVMVVLIGGIGKNVVNKINA